MLLRQSPWQGGDSPSDFDAGGAASRHVVRDIDTKQFLMFYEAVAADGGRSIGLAVSKVSLCVCSAHPSCLPSTCLAACLPKVPPVRCKVGQVHR